MYEGIIKNIDLNVDINAKKRVEGNIDVKLYSKDIGTGVFEFTFLNEKNQKIELDSTYSSRVMLKTDYDDNVYVTNIDIIDGIARFVFPHRFITKSGTVTLYLYLTKNDKTSDVASISFNVYRSEIDDVATDIITTYDKNYEDILADFEEYINISKDEWKALVKETSDFVKEIENITLDEFISRKMDEKYNNIEQNYITRLIENEQNIVSTNAQLVDIHANVKFHGAKGDGTTDDTQAIQSAVDFVVSKGGGKVFVPAGKYRTTTAIVLGDNVEFYGAGRYLSTFYPDWWSEFGFPDLITNTGTHEKRAKNIVIHDIGLDGSKLMFQSEGEGMPVNFAGHFARLHMKYVKGLHIYNYFAYHGSHVMDLRSCEDYIIDNIRADYCFNVVHHTYPKNEKETQNGIITNIVATRVASVIDWGAGGRDCVVSNINADAEGYIRNDQEAMDIGGASNIIIDNVRAKNFRNGFVVKGEAGRDWDNISISNVIITDFKRAGITVSAGSEIKSGKIKLMNCEFTSSVVEDAGPDKFAIDMIHEPLEVEMYSVKVVTNSSGVIIRWFKNLTIDGLIIESEYSGLRVGGLSKASTHFKAYDCTINNLEVTTNQFRAIELDYIYNFANLSNFNIKQSGEVGLWVRGVKKLTLSNGTISNTMNHGITITFDDDVTKKIGTSFLPDLNIRGVELSNWGKGKAYQSGLGIRRGSLIGDYLGINVSDVVFTMSDFTPNSQLGLVFNDFTDNSIKHSRFEKLSFINVPITSHQQALDETTTDFGAKVINAT